MAFKKRGFHARPPKNATPRPDDTKPVSNDAIHTENVSHDVSSAETKTEQIRDEKRYDKRGHWNNHGKNKRFPNNSQPKAQENPTENVISETIDDYTIEEETVPPVDDRPKTEIVGIKFRSTGKIYYFSPNGITFADGDHAIVETVRGMEYGDVAIANKMVPQSEIVSTLKPVIRKANKADDEKYAANLELEKTARPVWEENVRKNNLVMQLIDVEYTFDNSKLIFYFTADGRVDFRDLVKDLASVFRTRIELRQIGVRDEAKLIGGIGVCGRPFCCKTFLPDFSQVSIKMAKEQNLSLSSAKISGTCGRLMCCLRFEQDVYEMEYATFPKVDSIVQTPAGKGVITESNFLTGKIKVKMSDPSGAVKYFAPSDVKIIGRIKNGDDEDDSMKELEDN